RNLAARVGAAFDDHRAMLVGEHQQRHRHSDEIVEIGVGGKRRTKSCSRECGGDFLGGSFSGCAADRDQRDRTRVADSTHMMMREAPQRYESVVDLDAREICYTTAALDHRSGSTLLYSLREKRMPIGNAAQRDEERARD